MMGSPSPSSQPSGAVGVPRSERVLIGKGLRLAAGFISKERLSALFRAEAERAITLARGLSEEQGRTRVPVERVFGVEAGHCDWSVYMTLEHLVIVNTAIAALLPQLYSGHVVAEVRIEEAKPLPEAGPEQIEDLAGLVERYVEGVEKLGNLRAGTTLRHPWFGAFSAAQWHALAATHNGLHRRQIERIAKALR
jgi:hypothetical protein